jgi:hypothetical protein
LNIAELQHARLVDSPLSLASTGGKLAPQKITKGRRYPPQGSSCWFELFFFRRVVFLRAKWGGT